MSLPCVAFIAAVKGLQGDDILVSMGWSLGAATTLPTAVNLFYHGNMLLRAGVGGILLKQFETAELFVCRNQHFYYIATLRALVYFISLCHNVRCLNIVFVLLVTLTKITFFL